MSEAKRRRKIRQWYRNYKSNLSCTKCGESHPACLEFHHKKEKGNTISRMVSSGYCVNSIQKEMSKCIVVCSNCHKKIHYVKKDTIGKM